VPPPPLPDALSPHLSSLHRPFLTHAAARLHRARLGCAAVGAAPGSGCGGVGAPGLRATAGEASSPPPLPTLASSRPLPPPASSRRPWASAAPDPDSGELELPRAPPRCLERRLAPSCLPSRSRLLPAYRPVTPAAEALLQRRRWPSRRPLNRGPRRRLDDDCEASRGGRLRPLRPFPFPPPHTSFISSPPPPSPISHHHPRRGGRRGGGGSYDGAPPRAVDLFPRDCGRSVFHKCVMVPSKMKHSIHSTVEVSAQVPAAG
ncbi:unnamed protein product, partial [Urochloa humidicola]